MEKKKVVLVVDGAFSLYLYLYLLDHYPHLGTLDVLAFQQLARYLAAKALRIDPSKVEFKICLWVQGVRFELDEKGQRKPKLSSFLEQVQQYFTTVFLQTVPFKGQCKEKGVDVRLALDSQEAVNDPEVAMLVLVTCDGDFIPLADRTLNRLNKRVALISCTGKYQNQGCEGALFCASGYKNMSGLQRFRFEADFPDLLKTDPTFCQSLFYRRKT